jgi:hypothetical protein
VEASVAWLCVALPEALPARPERSPGRVPRPPMVPAAASKGCLMTTSALGHRGTHSDRCAIQTCQHACLQDPDLAILGWACRPDSPA